ncbi:MAG: flagellar FlbD family protein [Rubinisphaera brasiliensis]|uniref:Flagellar FlbD family protein n=1 Tax=Rubinisphaera brasiliensis (strain ATCC 49424 / DSM 5305 / JCM 21570 / IAM 15109 / NBRC 103401 / IFAM 1448) TaxID=756272 RepID=F0SNZ1_RUBBR|nr:MULTISPECIES: flagellar FlbD family protein [Rubinisphaera]ADY60067.1 flagellar FlbD family protein [Rubinisphaera brasiliensis DSM 5305]
MIKLTRLSGESFVLNANLIQYVESRPDTFITLTTEERVIVQESPDEVVRRSIEYSRSVRTIPGLAAH